MRQIFAYSIFVSPVLPTLGEWDLARGAFDGFERIS